MDSFKFVSTEGQQNGGVKVPFLEDATADTAPFHRVRKDANTIQGEIITWLAQLGAAAVWFQEGYFGQGGYKRYGYRVHFQYGGQRGLIRVAGLPIRDSETTNKINQVRVQALSNVREWLKTAVTSQVFSPGSDALIPHLLFGPGERTVRDWLHDQGSLPMLEPAEGDVVDGDWRDG